MATPTVTDIDTGELVSAERFAVEVSYNDGTTQVIGKDFVAFDDANAECERVERQIEFGEREDAFTVYVVAVGGSDS